MATYGDEKIILALGARIKQDCLIEQRSMLTGELLWTPEVFAELHRHYNDQPDLSSATFDDKILRQLQGASSRAWQLMAELYLLDVLVLGNIRPQTKVDKVESLLLHCEPPLSLDAAAVKRDILDTIWNGGVLSGGQGYNTQRDRQIAYLVSFGLAWSSLPREEREHRLADRALLQQSVRSLGKPSEAQIQNVLLYLLDPAGHVPITSRKHLDLIISTFGDRLPADCRTSELPEKAAIIRDAIRLERGSPDWDFYDDPDEWKSIRPEPGPVSIPRTEPQATDREVGDLPPFPDGTAASLLVDDSWLGQVHRLLCRRNQLVLQGPPGTGKTYLARRMASALAGSADRVTLVQFHPAYTYEDFFEGYRPNARGGLELRPGPLRRLAAAAAEDPERPYFLIIDEMNRGNLARIFGELYFLLEYRDYQAELMYSGEGFRLPKNLYIIGTMNTADRSIALVDAAMRRRFAFLSLDPAQSPTSDVLGRWCERQGLDLHTVVLWQRLNERLLEQGASMTIGPSYFMRAWVYQPGGLEELWATEILPQLHELFYGEEERVESEFALAALRP